MDEIQLYFKTSRKSILDDFTKRRGCIYITNHKEYIRIDEPFIGFLDLVKILNSISEKSIFSIGSFTTRKIKDMFYHTIDITRLSSGEQFLLKFSADYSNASIHMIKGLISDVFGWEFVKKIENQCFLFQSQKFSCIGKHADCTLKLFQRIFSQRNQKCTINSTILELCQSHCGKSTLFRLENGDEGFWQKIDALPGYKYIVTTQYDYPLKFQNKSVLMFAWIPPTTKWIIEQDIIRYNEIDATFKSQRPYAGFCFEGVNHNSGIPLIYSIAPTESLRAYEFAMDCLGDFAKRESISRETLTEHVLADMGSCIKSFCKNHKKKHYFCVRHLQQFYGPNSIFSPLIEIICNAPNAQILEKEKKMIAKILKCSPYPTLEKTPAFLKLLKEPQHYAKFHRLISNGESIFLIASSSNHLESLHSKMNHNASTTLLLEKRILSNLQTIQNRIDNFFLDPFQAAKPKLRELYIRAEKQNTPQVAECHCDDNRFNRALYEVDSYPCIHTVVNSDLIQKKSENRFVYRIKELCPITMEPISDLSHHNIIIRNDDRAWKESDGQEESNDEHPMTSEQQRQVTKLCSLLTNSQNIVSFKKFFYFSIRWIRKIMKCSQLMANLLLIKQITEFTIDTSGWSEEDFRYFSLQTICGLKGIKLSKEEIETLRNEYIKSCEYVVDAEIESLNSITNFVPYDLTFSCIKCSQTSDLSTIEHAVENGEQFYICTTCQTQNSLKCVANGMIQQIQRFLLDRIENPNLSPFSDSICLYKQLKHLENSLTRSGNSNIQSFHSLIAPTVTNMLNLHFCSSINFADLFNGKSGNNKNDVRSNDQ